MSNTNNEQIVEVIRGVHSFSFKRSSLAEIKDTHEGIIFMFRDQMVFNVVDNYMSLEIKLRIKQAVDVLSSANKIVINFNNPTQPVSMEA